MHEHARDDAAAPEARADAPVASGGAGGPLTHASLLALQRGAGNAAVAAMLQRQSVQAPSGAFVGDKGGATNNIREDVLPVMDRLHMLWSMSNDEYDAEYPNVAKKPPHSAIDPAELPKTISALKRNESKTVDPPVAQTFLDAKIAKRVGESQPNEKDDVRAVQDGLKKYGVLSGADHFTESTVEPNWSWQTKLDESKIPKTIDALAAFKQRAAAGTFRVDLFAGTKAVTAQQHAEVEAILAGPGAVVVPGSGGSPPVVKLPDPMKGAGPGGALEKEVLKAIDNYVKPLASEFKKKKAGGPTFPIAGAHDIADEAQKEVERYYAPFLAGASRQPGDKYHPGAYSLVSKLGDQSTRPLDDSWSASGRMGWLDYWATTKGYGIRDVLDKYHCLPSQRKPDEKEYARILDLYLNAPGNRPEIDEVIHSWGAEAGTGTVFIQPYGDPDPKAKLQQRWETFTTLIHEMMHVLEHPNFGETSNRIGKPAGTILTEGFAEVMRHDVWDGPGNLKGRLGTAELAPLREKVEGGKYPYDPSVVKDAPYYDEYDDAKKIVDTVGMPNAKAAFFLGHTDLLGLGTGTAAQTPLGGVAQWTPTDADTADTYVVGAGESEADVKRKTKGTTVLDAKGGVVASGAPLAAGTPVRVPGISWVWAVEGDTLGSVAKQHDVSTADLAAANGLSSSPSQKISPGTRLLIPVHGTV